MNRTPIQRGYAPKHAIELMDIQGSPSSNPRIQRIGVKGGISHYSPHLCKINYISDQNTATRIETNPIYDSRKEQNRNQNLEDWKILTLKQIKRSKLRAEREERDQSSNKSRQKICVSLSKSYNLSASKGHKNLTPSKSNVSDGGFKHLEKISQKRSIMGRVEHQIQIDNKSATIFC